MKETNEVKELNERERLLKKYNRPGLICLLIGLALFFTGFGLMMLSASGMLDGLGSFAEIIVTIIALPGMVLIIIAIVNFSKASKVKKLYCANCGEKFTYDDVEAKILGYSTNEYSPFVKARVAIRCHCPVCKNYQGFEKKFTVATSDGDGNVTTESLNEKLYNYFN